MAIAAVDSLLEVVAALPPAERARLERLYAVTLYRGELRVPPALRDWVTERFGSVASVSEQQVTRITNLVTQQETLFNPLRGRRPVEVRETEELETMLAQAAAQDSFADVRRTTTEDPFGRIVGKHCVTAGNIAKYDGWHGLIIFNDFHPLHFTRERISDYLNVAQSWAARAHQRDNEAKYFFLTWNCLWRAAASIRHGHAQVMLGRKRHYGHIERLRRAAADYRTEYGANYYDDLFQAHFSVGAAVSCGGVKIMAHLTPVKDNEIIVMADKLDDAFTDCLYEVMACFRDELMVTSFNLGLTMPPLAPTAEDWTEFPVMAWLVDRGDLGSRVSDIGGMELYAASVVATDPLVLAAKLKAHFNRRDRGGKRE